MFCFARVKVVLHKIRRRGREGGRIGGKED
jgi:hypothetical protein